MLNTSPLIAAIAPTSIPRIPVESHDSTLLIVLPDIIPLLEPWAVIPILYTVEVWLGVAFPIKLLLITNPTPLVADPPCTAIPLAHWLITLFVIVKLV